MRKVHTAAKTGYGKAADTYTRGRPGYPPEVSDWLQKDIGVGPGQVVLELGAGTGIFTARLAQSGADVIALEPVAAMRAQLQQALPGLRALEGQAEAIPLPDASVDAVICAQAFHWFANEAALGEIRRVLRPGGRLGLVWNVRDETVPWVAGLTDIMRPYEGDVARFHHGAWRRLFPAAGFTPLVEQEVFHTHEGRPEDVVLRRILSVSFIAALPEKEQEQVVKQLQALIDSTAELSGQTAAFPYLTLMANVQRLG